MTEGSPGKTNSHTLLEEVAGAYIARSPEGRTALLIPLSDHRAPPGRITGGVALAFGREVVFDVAERPFRAAAAIVECVDDALIPTFAVLARDIANNLRADVERPTPLKVSHALASWEELLRARQVLSREEEAGLWGELWLLSQFPDADTGVACWRGPDKDRIDFVGGGIGIECKSAFRRHEHYVSQSQLTRPLGDFEVYVLSLWVALDPISGQTIMEMVTRIEERVADPSAFERKLLAYGYSRADSPNYKLKLRLLEPPTWMPIAHVPRVREFDPGVTDIRFTATLDEKKAIPPEHGVQLLSRLVT